MEPRLKGDAGLADFSQQRFQISNSGRRQRKCRAAVGSTQISCTIPDRIIDHLTF